MRILVAVSNDRLCREIVELLTRAGHTCERAAATPAKQFDLALVGTAEIAETLRRDRPTAAIIVVTRIGDVPARIRALEAGADDAFDASFPASQIMARVGSAGRRAAMTPPAPERIAIEGCVIDLSASTVTRDGRTAALTTREVEIVRWLAAHAGHVVSRAELLQHVWRVAAGSATRAVDVAIVNLRAKLERDPASPAIIVSVRGAGYRWGP